MIANPHAKITFRDPSGHQYIFKRAAEIVPVLPKEVLPHPKGVTADDIITMAKTTDKRNFKSMLTSSLSRMSSKKINELAEITGLDMKKRPKSMKWEEAEAIVEAFDKMKFMAPPTDGLIPIGEEQIEKGMKLILKPEFITTITRKPITYKGGVAFIVEAGIAYGGDAGRIVNEQRKSEILRFANRVPLTFDQGSCAITEALKSIDWRRYGLRDFDNTPITLFVNIVSTQIPYLSTGKQSIAPEPEIVHEVRQATMKIARKLQKYLRSKRAEKEKAMRSKIFEDYVPVIIEEAANLAETEVPDYKPVLAKVTRRALAELLGEKIEDDEEEEDYIDYFLEELDEFGHEVDSEHSARSNRVYETDLDDAFKDDEAPKKKSKKGKKSKEQEVEDALEEEEKLEQEMSGSSKKSQQTTLFDE